MSQLSASSQQAGEGSRTPPPPFVIGIHLDGAGSHPAAWRDVEDGLSPFGAELLRRTLAEVEAAGFDFASFAGSHLPVAGNTDTPPRLDPVQQAAFAGPLTARIALLPEVPVTYVEPFHTATQLASLDYASAGRAGWLVSAENSAHAARQYGREELTEDALTNEVIDVVAVARRLWDTWEHGAVIKDLPTGRYIDREKLHYADFEGRSFSVKGPAITPRPPQGQLPVAVPLEHAAGVDADIVLVAAGPDLEERVSSARALGIARVIVDLEVVLDSRGESAAARLARLDGHVGWPSSSRERFIGSAEQLIELLRKLHNAVDGVRIIPASTGRDLDELRYAVLPVVLAESGKGDPRPSFHPTARQVFALPEAENVFAGASELAQTGSN